MMPHFIDQSNFFKVESFKNHADLPKSHLIPCIGRLRWMDDVDAGVNVTVDTHPIDTGLQNINLNL